MSHPQSYAPSPITFASHAQQVQAPKKTIRVEIEFFYDSEKKSQRKVAEDLLSRFRNEIEIKDLQKAAKHQYAEYRDRLPCLVFSKVIDGAVVTHIEDKHSCVRKAREWHQCNKITVPEFLVSVRGKKVVKGKGCDDVSFDTTRSSTSSSSSSTSSSTSSSSSTDDEPRHYRARVASSSSNKKRLSELQTRVEQLEEDIRVLKTFLSRNGTGVVFEVPMAPPMPPMVEKKGVYVEVPDVMDLKDDNKTTTSVVPPQEQVEGQKRIIEEMLARRDQVYAAHKPIAPATSGTVSNSLMAPPISMVPKQTGLFTPSPPARPNLVGTVTA